jgi:uncharacterized protein (TIGR03067 family)
MVGQGRGENPGVHFVFAGNQVSMVGRGNQAPPMRFVLDSSQEPKAVDFTTQDGAILRGIYQVDGESLQLCVDFGEGGNRPASFRPEAGNTLFVMRREKALPGRP